MAADPVRLKKRQKLGKYRIERRLAVGPYATVFEAMDTIECRRVALKIPNTGANGQAHLDDFKREVRLAARLRHPNVLPLKDASYVEGLFTIVTPLGIETLATRLTRRLSLATRVSFAEQLIEALAYAHGERVLHCDVKPENLILFAENRLMLGDFGIAKQALRTIKASGSGTLGYLSPEQAMGRPSPRSDVFAAGLIIYRMFAGHLPEWPYRWPPAGYAGLRNRVSPEMLRFLRRALSLEPARRFRDARAMATAFTEVKRRGALARKARKPKSNGHTADWRQVRFRQFQRQFGRELETHAHCSRCEGPIAQSMRACPWCGTGHDRFRGETRYPAVCPSCHRGVKLDWAYCAWCYGAGFEIETNRHYSDKRYQYECSKADCGGPLMPFMRYCPWCRAKNTQPWQLNGNKERCASCGWGVAAQFWKFCPWCTKAMAT